MPIPSKCFCEKKFFFHRSLELINRISKWLVLAFSPSVLNVLIAAWLSEYKKMVVGRTQTVGDFGGLEIFWIRFCSHSASLHASRNAVYSTFIVDVATSSCFFDCQDIRFPSYYINTYPLTDFLSFKSSAQSGSVSQLSHFYLHFHQRLF